MRRLVISGRLVGGLRNSALDYTASGMVVDFLAKSYGGLSWEGIYLGSKRRNLSNQGELHYKLYEDVEEALEN